MPSDAHPYRSTLYACYLGYVVQAIVNNIAPLLFIVFQQSFFQQSLEISHEMLGRLILLNFGTQIAADVVSLRISDRVGYRRMAVAAHFFSALGLVLLGVLPQVMPDPYTALMIAVVVYAIGGGIIEVIISPIVESLPGDEKASAMSLLHSFYCWGQLGVVVVTTLLLSLIGWQAWWILPVLWALVPLYNLVRFLQVPLLPTVADEVRTPIRRLISNQVFLVALVLMVCAGASELTMSQWSSFFVERALEFPKVWGDLLGPSLFAVFMGIGRTLYGIYGNRIEIRRAMLWSGVLCVLCYGLTVFAPHPALALAGLVLCGFSVSLMWPGTYSLSAARFPLGGVAMFGMLAVMGDVGAATGPWLAGFASDIAQASNGLTAWGAQFGLSAEQVGLRAGLLVAIVFPLAMVVGLLWLQNQRTDVREIE